MINRSPQVVFDFTLLSRHVANPDTGSPRNEGLPPAQHSHAPPETDPSASFRGDLTEQQPSIDTYSGDRVIAGKVEARTSSAADHAAVASRLRSFAECSSDAIIMADLREGAIHYLSPAAQRIWGNRPPLTTIADWEASIHLDDLTFARDRREMVRQGHRQRFQYRILGSNGDIARHVRETSFPMPSHDGAGVWMGGIVEDISPEISVYLVSTSKTANAAVADGLRNVCQRVTTFSSEKELMNVAEVLHPGCVVIDASDAAPSPETLLRLLSLRPAEMQVIIVGQPGTKPGDVIDALKAGASDYLIQPFTSDQLANAIDRAGQALALPQFPKAKDSDTSRERLTSLPSREREVFLGLVAGGTNKSIARTLNLSPRTVEVHRAHLMQRLNLRNLTELLHFAHLAGV